jgi:hypothetical protein
LRPDWLGKRAKLVAWANGAGKTDLLGPGTDSPQDVLLKAVHSESWAGDDEMWLA